MDASTMQDASTYLSFDKIFQETKFQQGGNKGLAGGGGCQTEIWEGYLHPPPLFTASYAPATCTTWWKTLFFYIVVAKKSVSQSTKSTIEQKKLI